MELLASAQVCVLTFKPAAIWRRGTAVDSFTLLLTVIGLTLIFEFSNGWHDAANSIATVVSTRVLTPFRAVAWAAFWNFVAAFVFGTAVAKTIGKGMVHIETVDQKVLLAGLLGAISWNLITLILGLPTSSSHALMGGYGGAAVAKSGFRALILSGWTKPVLFIFLAPIIGLMVRSGGDDRDELDRATGSVQEGWINGFGGCNCFRPLRTVWATEPMTRKKAWELSLPRWWLAAR